MAGSLFMEISKDEQERAHYRSRRMFETDQISNILTAEERGEKRGKNEMALKVAQAMKAKNEPFEKIVEYTGLNLTQVEEA